RTGLEPLREAFVEPAGDVRSAAGVDERVRHLVAEHAIERRLLLAKVFHRDAHAAVVEPAGPVPDPGDFVKALAPVEDDADPSAPGLDRKAAERFAELEVDALQDLR